MCNKKMENWFKCKKCFREIVAEKVYLMMHIKDKLYVLNVE